MTGSIEGAEGQGAGAGPVRREVSARDTARANRSWWDAQAGSYQAEHGEFLGDARFVWGPEGVDEADVGLLGPVEGRDVLEIGSGAAQCSRWLVGEGARPVATDLSFGQLAHSARLDTRTGTTVPVAQADACALPFRNASFDLVCSAYGAVPFVADVTSLHREVARVLRPGGRWVFSVSHPVRWALPDDPGRSGLRISHSYFDRTPYAETDDAGTVTYVEHHRTLGDHVRALVAAGLTLLDVVEPEWPERNAQVWGGWSPLRGRLIPGTAIFVAGLD